MLKISKENVLILSFFFILLIISLLVIKDFIIPLIFAFILTYILNPVYKKLLKFIRNKEITSLLLSLFLFILIILPLSLMTLNLTKEINNINDQKIINNLNIISNDLNKNYGININFSNQYKLLFEKIKDELHEFFLKIPSFLFQIFLIVFFYYYFSKDYSYEINFFKKKFNPSNYKFLKLKFEKLISGIIYGQIFVRFVQSIIAIICFLIIGLNSAVITGVMIFFAAFLPVIGTGIIWLPLALIKFLNHEYYIGFMIILIGIFISTIDNFLLPYIISEKTNIGPVVTLISILGGINLFGLYGIILGPLFVGLLFIFLDDIFERFKKSNPEINRFIWSEKERKKFKSLKSEKEKTEFIQKINMKYLNSINNKT